MGIKCIKIHKIDTCRWSIDRHYRRHWPISRPILNRYIGRHSSERLDRHSVTTRPTPDRYIDRHFDRQSSAVSIATSVDTPYYTQERAFRHLSIASIDRHYRRHSADISADTEPTYRLTIGRDIDRHLVEVAMFFKLVHRQSPVSVHAWSICPSSLGRHFDR